MSNMKREIDDKRERVLNAALECFKLYGLKRTSMDDIAQKAALSRPALYLLFPNKEAIFRTGLEHLHDAALARMGSALREDRPLAERLVAAFEGKNLALLELVLTSPHGTELVNLHRGIGADIAQRAEHRFQELLAQAFYEADAHGEIALSRIGLDANQYAELLILAAHGLKEAPASLELYRQQLAHLIRVFCAAVMSEH